MGGRGSVSVSGASKTGLKTHKPSFDMGAEVYSTKHMKNGAGVTLSGANRQMVEYLRDYYGVDLTERVMDTSKKFGGGIIVRTKDISINEMKMLKGASAYYGGNVLANIESWSAWQTYIQPNKNNDFVVTHYPVKNRLRG